MAKLTELIQRVRIAIEAVEPDANCIGSDPSEVVSVTAEFACRLAGGVSSLIEATSDLLTAMEAEPEEVREACERLARYKSGEAMTAVWPIRNGWIAGDETPSESRELDRRKVAEHYVATRKVTP